MAKTKTNDVLPMNDKMKTVREALEEAIAIDRRDNVGDPSMYTTQLESAIAALDAMEAEAHPKAQGEVELTEEEVDRLSDEIPRIYKTPFGVVQQGVKDALRHITSKYRLIPR